MQILLLPLALQLLLLCISSACALTSDPLPSLLTMTDAATRSRGATVIRVRSLAVGVWGLEFGVWGLGVGVLMLGAGALAFGVCAPELERRCIKCAAAHVAARGAGAFGVECVYGLMRFEGAFHRYS